MHPFYNPNCPELPSYNPNCPELPSYNPKSPELPFFVLTFYAKLPIVNLLCIYHKLYKLGLLLILRVLFNCFIYNISFFYKNNIQFNKKMKKTHKMNNFNVTKCETLLLTGFNSLQHFRSTVRKVLNITDNRSLLYKSMQKLNGMNTLDLFYNIYAYKSNHSLFTFSKIFLTCYFRTVKKISLQLELRFQNPPRPHQFSSIELKSSGLGSNSIAHLLQKKKNMEKEIDDISMDSTFFSKELNKAKSTLTLSKHVDDTKNNPLRELKNDYPTFFDLDSGNNTAEGLKQVMDYLREEHSELQSRSMKLKTTVERFDRQIAKSKQADEQLGGDSNVNSMLIIATRRFHFFRYLSPFINNALPYFSLLVTICSFLFVSFIFPSLDLPCFIQDIIDFTNEIFKYEIAKSLPILL